MSAGGGLSSTAPLSHQLQQLLMAQAAAQQLGGHHAQPTRLLLAQQHQPQPVQLEPGNDDMTAEAKKADDKSEEQPPALPTEVGDDRASSAPAAAE